VIAPEMLHYFYNGNMGDNENYDPSKVQQKAITPNCLRKVASLSM
jgi:hypothetical protein